MKYLKVFTDFATSIEALSDAEKGRLFVAMMKYAESGQESDLRGGERIIWGIAKQMIDRERETYLSISERNRKNATCRSVSQRVAPTGCHTLQDKDKDKDKDSKKDLPSGRSKEAQKRFTPPSVADVEDYCREICIEIDAERFVDYYTARGWKVGGEPMQDWQSAVRVWCSRDKDRPARQRDVYHNSRSDDEDMEQLLKDLENGVIVGKGN